MLIGIRILLSVISLSATILCAWFWYKEREPVLIVPLTWLINLSLFWFTRLLSVPMNITWINLWSGMIHLHAIVLIIGALIIFRKQEWRRNKDE